MKIIKNIGLSVSNGDIAVLSALLLGSCKPVLIKSGITGPILTPAIISFISAAIAGAIVFIFNRPDLKFFKNASLYIPGVLLLLNTFLTAIALNYTNLATVTAIIALTPIVVAFHKALIDKSMKNLGWFLAGFIFAFVGVLQVIEINNFSDLKLSLPGIFFAFSAVIVSDIYRLFLERKSLKIEPETLSAMIIITGSIFGFVCMLFYSEKVVTIDYKTWGIILLLAIAIAYSHLLFVKGLKKIGAITTSLILIMQPAVVIFLGALFIAEPLKINHITGISLIILGLFVFKLPSVFISYNNWLKQYSPRILWIKNIFMIILGQKT